MLLLQTMKSGIVGTKSSNSTRTSRQKATVRSNSKSPACLAAATLLFGMGSQSHALIINVIDLTGGTEAVALAAFEDAADLWEARFADPVEVNVEFDFADLGAGILGGTSSSTAVFDVFFEVAPALTADALSTDDGMAVANLPHFPNIPDDFLNFRTNDDTGAVFLDDGTISAINNIFLDVNTANAKAIGLIPALDPGVDASIEFNSVGVPFDFDPSDGITAGSFDFVGVSAHEIGHALGFVSGVDIVDIFTDAGPLAVFNPLNVLLESSAYISVLDLFRYSADSLALDAYVLDLATGPHPGGLPYLSIDGGATSLGGTLETGSFNGTGRQASHWKDSLGFGIMDPTASPGELLGISGLDIKAFDVIGWDLTSVVIPEPGSMMLLGVAGIFCFGYRWRQKKRAA